MSAKPFCVRCLIREMTDRDALAQIRKYQSQVPDHEKADDELYEERLTVCKECKYRHLGTCLKCGGYAEARAYRTAQHCPLGEQMW